MFASIKRFADLRVKHDPHYGQVVVAPLKDQVAFLVSSDMGSCVGYMGHEGMEPMGMVRYEGEEVPRAYIMPSSFIDYVYTLDEPRFEFLTGSISVSSHGTKSKHACLRDTTWKLGDIGGVLEKADMLGSITISDFAKYVAWGADRTTRHGWERLALIRPKELSPVLKTWEVVATDGKLFARVLSGVATYEGEHMLIDSKFFTAMRGTSYMYLHGERLLFVEKGDDMVVFSPYLSDIKYPKVDIVLDVYDPTIEVEYSRKVLLEALSRIEKIFDDKFQGVELYNGYLVTANWERTATAVERVSDDTTQRFCFNAAFLSRLLKIMTDDSVYLGFTGNIMTVSSRQDQTVNFIARLQVPFKSEDIING